MIDGDSACVQWHMFLWEQWQDSFAEYVPIDSFIR